MSHIHEKIDFTVETFITYHNTVLLRKHDKYKIWLGVGGHIDLDEDPNQAAVREVKEEVGLDVRLCGEIKILLGGKSEDHELLPPRYLCRHRINNTHEHIALVYFAVADTNSLQQGETEISEECRWFTAQELNDPTIDIQENIRHYALAALDECK